MKSQRIRQLEARLSEKPAADAPAAFAEDGTDLTQIRAFLELSPTERLRQIQSVAQSIERLQRAVRRNS